MTLKERLVNQTAVFGVVGLGYVGLPLAVEMAAAGFRVTGFDVVGDKVADVNAGASYIPDVPSEDIARLREAGRLEATTDFSRAGECDAIVVCVPTPLNEMKEPDVTYMIAAAKAIAPHLTRGTLVTLESTTYPGTTEEVLQPILEADSGLKVGEGLSWLTHPSAWIRATPSIRRRTPQRSSAV